MISTDVAPDSVHLSRARAREAGQREGEGERERERDIQRGNGRAVLGARPTQVSMVPGDKTQDSLGGDPKPQPRNPKPPVDPPRR